METNQPCKKILDSRRSFIKTKMIGGLFGILGIPLFTLGKGLLNEDLPAMAAPLKESKNLNWEEIRDLFTLDKSLAYFNTSSYGPSHKLVINSIIELLEHNEARASYQHSIMHSVRKKIGRLLNANTDHIAITRNTTEGMNTVARSLSLKEGDEVILSKDEHIGGAAIWLALSKEIGITIKLVDLDYSGKNNFNIIKKSVTDKTKVLVLSHVTCTTGMILPVKKIANYCKKKGIISCIDGAQAVGMIPVNITDINPDFYVTSGHKWLFGSKGTGILYINEYFLKNNSPHYVGAYSDSAFNLGTKTFEYLDTASREEYGTRNLPIIAGLGSAIDFISEVGMEKISLRGQQLAEKFRDGISTHPRITILTPEKENGSGSIITFKIQSKDNIQLSKALGHNYSIRLRAIFENDINGLRASFAIFNSEEEVDLLIKVILEDANS
jgi:selenocysteine lyase/cysteine desulfurase